MQFILKRPSAKTTGIILLAPCYDGRLKYYTGESVNPTQWPSNINDGTKAILRRIEAHLSQVRVDYKIKGEPLTRQILKASLDELLNRKSKDEFVDMFAQMDHYIDKMQTGEILTPGKKRYSKGSIKTFRFTVNFLKAFNPKLTIKSTSLSTYASFIRWCQQKQYSINYIGSQIKNWKTLGKAVGGNPVFEDPGFKKIQEETFDVYLDEKELAKMFALQLKSREDVARDWFILDCYTGLRVSDLVLLTKKNYSKGYITIANKKTDEKVVIPAHPYVKKIVAKYKGFPPVISDIEINRTIKKVVKKAGIKSEVLFTITKGGKRQDHYLKKWEMVSCHTARRSFITNLRKNGIADTIVMKLTGIKSAATLKRYDRLSQEEAARIAAGHKFFK